MTRYFAARFGILLPVAACAVMALPTGPTQAQVFSGKKDPDGITSEQIDSLRDQIRANLPRYFVPRGGGVTPEALPDVDGPGAVLTVGNVYMKVTNWGHCGNFFTNRSSDPAGQWPGASGVEYLSTIRLAVGAVNPTATDPTAIRRVSYLFEWRPETLQPEDKIYRAYDGIVNGARFVNDDGDHELDGTPKIDEDFLDGHDNDGDGQIDEDHAALGQQEYSLVMWDNTLQAVNTTFNEKHVPIGLECRQRTWAYSIAGFQDFDVIEYQIFNRSGHILDSLVIGWLVDMDCGPVTSSSFFQDDFDLPKYPQGDFVIKVGSNPGDLPDPKRAQFPHDPRLDGAVGRDSALCPRDTIRIRGFSVADDNGDEQKTTGIPSFLLIQHTIDPLGISGPKRVGWRAFRSITAGTPYASGGNPSIDQQRYEFMTSNENIDPETGLITSEPGDTKNDYFAWCSIGPWLNVPAGGSITATVAFAVAPGDLALGNKYANDYVRYQGGLLSGADLLAKYPSLRNAFTAQIAYEGIHEPREGFIVPDYHGRETPIKLPLGTPQMSVSEPPDCANHEPRTATVNDREYTWFDFDCNYCTGVWDYASSSPNNPSVGGMFHKTWNAAAPPPNPNLNVAVSYNYSDNPTRQVVPSGDHAITLAWDNLSETTPDPKTQWLDFRGYRLWKVSDWTRPVGSAGPSEEDWRLIGEFRLFEYEGTPGTFIERNYTVDPVTGEKQCPEVFIPNYAYYDSVTHEYKQGKKIPICLDHGDLWDRQTGQIIKPDTSLKCVGYPGPCVTTTGCIVHHRTCSDPENQIAKIHYPVGRYRYMDREVKNGFTYFYSVTALDSTTDLGITTELGGRRSAVESEGVVPQTSTRTGKQVWVVPNPYRGYGHLSQRPSAWDLTPNASDPTGTHIDFFGLPSDKWTIRIFTASGDLVAEIHSDDAVNESIRSPVKDPSGAVDSHGNPIVRPGYNRQQDNPNDGQASWNLISRNGQDIVSGIYIFTVESKQGTQRGKFVVIR